MATGSPLPAAYINVNNSASTTSTTSWVLGSTAGGGRCRVAAAWGYSTSATITTPTGWSALYDAVVGNFRCSIFYRPNQDVTVGTNVTATYSAACWNNGNCNAWEGLAATPLVGTPVTASGTGTSMSIGSMTLPDDAVLGLWFWAVYYATGATSGTVTLPADLVSSGTSTPTVTTGIVARCGGWTSGNTARVSSPLRSPTTTGAKAATASAGLTAWAGIGLALRPADQGGAFTTL